MKIVFLLFSLIFSFTVLGDCCMDIEVEEVSSHLASADNCDDFNSSTESHEDCGCSFTCGPKLLKIESSLVLNSTFAYFLPYPKHLDVFKNLEPSPIIQPPIL